MKHRTTFLIPPSYRSSARIQARPVALKALPVPKSRVQESSVVKEAPKPSIVAPMSAALLSSPLWLLSALPAEAFEFNGYSGSMNSYYVTLGTHRMHQHIVSLLVACALLWSSNKKDPLPLTVTQASSS